MGRTFDGREIVKTTINIGIAGQIEVADALPSLSVVEFTAKARVGAIKHKFLENGNVEEIVILTLNPETFEVLGIEKAPEQGELPLAGVSTGPLLPAVAPQEKVASPLLNSCEGCGHGRETHEDGAAACRVPACTCQTFVEPPANTPPVDLPENQGTVTKEETDAVVEKMQLHGPLLVKCACGHPRGNHADATGRCLDCDCGEFAEPMTVDEAAAAMDHEMGVGGAGLMTEEIVHVGAEVIHIEGPAPRRRNRRARA